MTQSFFTRFHCLVPEQESHFNHFLLYNQFSNLKIIACTYVRRMASRRVEQHSMYGPVWPYPCPFYTDGAWTAFDGNTEYTSSLLLPLLLSLYDVCGTLSFWLIAACSGQNTCGASLVIVLAFFVATTGDDSLCCRLVSELFDTCLEHSH